MLLATGLPVGPIIDAFCGIHIPCMVWSKKLKFTPFSPKMWKFAFQPMAAWRAIIQKQLKIGARCLCQSGAFSASGNQMESFKFQLDPQMLPWQQVDVIWTQNRLLLSLY